MTNKLQYEVPKGPESLRCYRTPLKERYDADNEAKSL